MRQAAFHPLLPKSRSSACFPEIILIKDTWKRTKPLEQVWKWNLKNSYKSESPSRTLMGRLTIKEPLDPLPGWDASLLCGHSERCLPEGFVIKGKRWRPRQTIQPALVSSVQGTFPSVMVASWWFLVRISPSLYPSLCHHLILLCYRSLRKISTTWVHHVILRPCL